MKALFAILVVCLADTLFAAAPGSVTGRILVDQFGYLPDAKKIAVLSDPQTGYNAAASYQPGPSLELRRTGSNTAAISSQGAAAAYQRRKRSRK